MKVMNDSNLERKQVTSALFEGAVTRQSPVDEKTSKTLRIAIVHFSRGAKNVFHTHSADQVLYVTEGKGIVATETEETLVGPGAVIFFPAGERHWHGATADTSFSHLSISTPGETKY